MNHDFIEVIGARENNLKNVSLQIPKGKITIFTGVSGSGKSSMVFDTIASEAGRQLNETFSAFLRTYLPRYSQPDADSIENLSTAIVVDQKRLGGNARSTVGTITDINTLIRLLFSRFGQPHIGYANHFSFNDPNGMCPECEGIGKIITLDLDKALDMEKSLNEGAILLSGYKVGGWQWKLYSGAGFFDNDKKIKDYTEEEFDKLVYAKAEKVSVEEFSDFSPTYMGLAEKFIQSNIKSQYEKSDSSKKKADAISKKVTCPLCHGKRYNETALSSKILGYSIFDLTEMQLDELMEALKKIEGEAAAPIVKSLVDRVQNIIDIGLDYINLNRETASLSGGESQRIKMVKQLTSSLNNVMYIFDEPSIGLHPRDVYRLNELLMKLRDKGNTVVVVEHDPDVIKIADYVIDMGPKAGSHGGEVVFSGSYEELRHADTLTGKFIGRKMEVNQHPRESHEFYETSKSSLHNLKNISLRIPKGIFTAITGVAGSGKSTIVSEVFAKEYPEAIRIDQNAVSANARSNPATFTGIMDSIRSGFAEANEVSAGLFSYNSEGACPNCKGTGTVELNLSFMDSVSMPCEECGGKRYKDEVLQYRYKGKTIVDVMAMTIKDAEEFFEVKEIRNKIKNINAVGLSYMTLGQPLNTLSGGECQRLKLAKELNKKGNIYILDEPTTGLHMSDIEHILTIIQKLVKKGNTVIVIEHNIDIIKNADWIIDLGKDGGSRGGEIVFEGKPADLLNSTESFTAKYLNS